MEEILKQIALENRTTVGSVKKEIEFAIHEAMNNSQTDSKNFWNELSYAGLNDADIQDLDRILEIVQANIADM